MYQLQYRNKNESFISNFVFQFIKKKTKWHFKYTDSYGCLLVLPEFIFLVLPVLKIEVKKISETSEFLILVIGQNRKLGNLRNVYFFFLNHVMARNSSMYKNIV